MQYFITIIVAVILLVGMASSCPSVCGCTNTSNGVNVDCSSRGLDRIPTELPSNTYILELQNNAISVIEDNTFNNLPSLYELRLNNNNISVIENNAFNNLPSLQYIRMDNNPIAFVSEYAFENLPNLTSLAFDMYCGSCGNIPFCGWLKGYHTFNISITCKDFHGKHLHEVPLNNGPDSSDGPRQVVIYPTTSNYTRNETLDGVGPINCTANCQPACTSTWNGPNLPPGTTSVLSLPNISRTQAGNYQCTARNNVSSLISATIYVVVYYQPTISSISSNKTVSENNTATINCTVDSIPQSTIRWIFETKELENKYDGSLTLNNIDCLSMGRYTCHAVNMLGVDNRYVNVAVTCSPRINWIEFTIPSTVTIKDKGMLNITAHIIAFPKPEMYWQFDQRGSYVNVSSGITNSFNINRHSSNLVKSNLTHDDFGTYYVFASNGVGNINYLLHSVVVVHARKPNQPINVICEGRINSATVYWKSGFNGGEKQAFTVYYKRNENDGNSKWTAFGTKYSDPGQNMNISAEIQPLEAGTSFVFQINASNAYSYTVSESSYCNTSEAVATKLEDITTAVVGASIATVIVVIIIVLVILRYRRKKTQYKGLPVLAFANLAFADADADA